MGRKAAVWISIVEQHWYQRLGLGIGLCRHTKIQQAEGDSQSCCEGGASCSDREIDAEMDQRLRDRRADTRQNDSRADV